MTPVAKELMRVFDAYDQEKIASILSAYAAAVEALGSPRETRPGGPLGLGDGVLPTKLEVLAAAVRSADRQAELKHRWLYTPYFGEVREHVVERLLQLLEGTQKDKPDEP